MKAQRNSWKNITPFPSKYFTLAIDKNLSDKEMTTIEKGKIPNGMDDRWFIFYEAPFLYFHRSWSKKCIYKVKITDNRIENVMVNGLQEEFKSSYLNGTFKEKEEEETFKSILGILL